MRMNDERIKGLSVERKRTLKTVAS